jgi:PKD repeat protein
MLRVNLPALLVATALTPVAAGLSPTTPQAAGGDPAAAPQGLPAHWFGPGPLHTVRVAPEDLAALPARAVLRSEDYGSFVQAVVDEAAFGGADALRAFGLDVRDEQDLMVFNDLVLDGTRPELLLRALDPTQLFTDPSTLALPPDAGLYVLQFDGPVKDAWLDAVRATGARVVQSVPMNAYVVAAEASAVQGLEALQAGTGHVQFLGVYEPPYRLHASLRAALLGFVDEAQPVTVQVLDGDGVRDVIALVASMADALEGSEVVGPYVNVRALLHPAFFTALAGNPRIFDIEPRGVRVPFDEAQGQIAAGNVSGASPTGPGYLAWLAAQGFTSSQFGSFAVNVVDDATSLAGHPDLASGRIAFTQNPSGQTGSQGGHGFLNAQIVAGQSSGTGAALEDALGFNYGLGIAPWARVGSTAIFGPGATNPTSYESSAYASGARISTNSWGFQTAGGAPIPDYDANAQTYDVLARDAQSGVAGLQQYLILFAAGNDGPGANTVSTPGTAKNVLTVGASENVRQTGTDGCGIGNTGANNLNDIISFSSRGPVAATGGDGRWKPELVAPGTHVEAGVPQSSYSGASVCNQFWPAGQTLYGWSSGTSHSTPAVAGGAALVYQWFLNHGLGTPSPALIKAVLVNAAEYLNGVGANDTLPSNSQGMGLMDLGRAFGGAATLRVDQTQLLTATGGTFVQSGNIASGSLPLRVTLAWTDAPGPTSGAPWVNDLDLEVVVGGTTYRGNVFSGAASASGGAADIRNNTESVFLPAGATGAFTVTVRGSSIAGDGVPGNGDTTDQDFALVISNASAGAVPPTANFTASPTSGSFPLNVSFTDASSAGVTAWSWTFGDGGTSTAKNPAHTYAAAGSYTVSLTVTDPVGSDNETKVGYVHVTAPPTAGIGDGGFEAQTAGAAPAAPWTVVFGTGHVIDPTGVSSDGGMPSQGAKWAEISAASTNAATPPSNPGGQGTPPVGGAGIRQSFSYPAGQTTLSFDAAFLRNESAASSFNDFMSVDVTDGSTTRNLYYADTFTATAGTSAKHGYAMTAVAHVSANLTALFPASTTATTFSVTAVVGNGSDGMQPSLGYVDGFALGGATAPPVAGFTGAPTSGTAPLPVTFTDASTGSITSRTWTFGDGGTSTAANPSHTYAAAGTYTVSLTVTGPGGSNTLTRTNYVTASPPSGGGLYYLSFSTNTALPGIGTVSDEDVVTYDAGTGQWALYFDGSDVGLASTDVDALEVRANGALILSFDSATFAVSGLTGGPSGTTVEDSDLILFTPATTGATTSGGFSFLLDGSDLGLTTDNEDIDAVDELPGALRISTLGTASVTGASAEDEDVLNLANPTFGSASGGTWSLYFDGSDVGLASSSDEDVDALDFPGGSLLFSTAGAYSAAGAAGEGEDVSSFTGTFGSATSGSASLVLDLSALGISTAAGVDGVAFLP